MAERTQPELLAAFADGQPAGSITPSDARDLVDTLFALHAAQATALDGKAAVGHAHADLAPLASPAFTGAPTAPTPLAAENSTRLVTAEWVRARIADLVASSPAALDTLNELAAALGNDPAFATTMATALGLRLRVDAAQGLTGAQQLQALTNLGSTAAGRTLLAAADAAAQRTALGAGVAGGLATLGGDGKVPAAQLPAASGGLPALGAQGMALIAGASAPEYDWPLIAPWRARESGGGGAAADTYGLPSVVLIDTASIAMPNTAAATYWAPFVAMHPWTYDQVFAEVVTAAATAGATLRFGLATLDKQMRLVALVREFGTVAADSAGTKTLTPGAPITEPPGRYALLLSVTHQTTIRWWRYGSPVGGHGFRLSTSANYTRGVLRADAPWPSDLSGAPFNGGQQSGTTGSALHHAPFLFRLSADHGGR